MVKSLSRKFVDVVPAIGRAGEPASLHVVTTFGCLLFFAVALSGCGKRLPPKTPTTGASNGAASPSPSVRGSDDQPANAMSRAGEAIVLPTPRALPADIAENSSGSPDGSSANDRASEASSIERTSEANDVIRRLLDAYRQASSYSDHAKLTLRFQQGTDVVEDVTEILVSFARPNRVALEIVNVDNRVVVRGDGQQLATRIVDAATNNFDNQQVARSQASELAVADLYAVTELVDPAAPGQMLNLLMGLPVRMEFGPLGLLLEAPPFLEFLRTAPASLLPDETIEGRPCQVVQIGILANRHVLWIDSDSRLLRRIQYPTPPIPPEVPAAAAPREMQLIADFADASWRTAVGVSFQLDSAVDRAADSPTGAVTATSDSLPATASERTTRGRYFVLPPLPLPTELLGQVIKPLTLQDLYDRQVSSSDWPDRVLVLTWFNDHPASASALEQLQQVYLRFRSDERVHINAVCVEPIEKMSHAEISRRMDDWKVDVVPLRDRTASGRDALKVEVAPTTVVIHRDGTLQMLQVGAHPQLANETSAVVERLLDGQNVARDVLANVRQYAVAYRQALATARADGTDIATIPTPQVVLSDQRLPQHLKLTPAWTMNELNAPGNMLVVGQGESARLLVINGWREIVELSLDGKIVQRHPLAIPADTGISFVRAYVDVNSKVWYAAAARGGGQAFVFDHLWQPIVQHPAAVDSDAGVFDVQIADLDATPNGPELYVGWQGLRGVDRVERGGDAVWTNRSIANVLSLTIARPTARTHALLISGEQGVIGIVNPAGTTMRELPAEPYAIHQLCAAKAGREVDAVSEYCGLSFTVEGRLLAIGLDRNLKSQWNFPLPLGTYRHQVETMQSAWLWNDQAPQWLFAGPDGSVHCVSSDGTFHDNFAVGEHLSGLTAVRDDVRDRFLLMIATGNAIRAFQVEKVAK